MYMDYKKNENIKIVINDNNIEMKFFIYDSI